MKPQKVPQQTGTVSRSNLFLTNSHMISETRDDSNSKNNKTSFSPFMTQLNELAESPSNLRSLSPSTARDFNFNPSMPSTNTLSTRDNNERTREGNLYKAEESRSTAWKRNATDF